MKRFYEKSGMILVARIVCSIIEDKMAVFLPESLLEREWNSTLFTPGDRTAKKKIIIILASRYDLVYPGESYWGIFIRYSKSMLVGYESA